MIKKEISEYSFFLHKNMNIIIYGKSKGYPILVFPSQDGVASDYERFGMVDSLKQFIDDEEIQLFCVDSIDKISFSDEKGDKEKRIRFQEDYYEYITKEVVSFIHKRNHSSKRILVTGNSMGGFHSTNFLLRRPDLFEGVISLSGVFNATIFFDGWMNNLVYLNSPIHYMKNMKIYHPYVEMLRKRKIYLCVGQGRWEEEGLLTQPILANELKRLNIDAFIDYWGKDVDHDWYWWKKQIVYFLPMFLNSLKVK